jgi:2-keto-4-pentenoate hydratase/2-oxohepta-3-ene-1,7-dioic acid hydratase in catechol pathway
MRFISFEQNGQQGVGWLKSIQASEFVDLRALGGAYASDLKTLIATPGALNAAHEAALAAPASAVKPLNSVKLQPVIPNPGKIVCMGLNYADHAKEGGNARPEYPSFFMRGATSMVGHQGAIIRPKVSSHLDYEAELAVIIGKRARHLTKENALDCIAGYACFNDASLRDYQRKTAQWTIGKNFDGTGPFGPCMVTPDELPSGAAFLRKQSDSIDLQAQSSTTSYRDMQNFEESRVTMAGQLVNMVKDWISPTGNKIPPQSTHFESP